MSKFSANVSDQNQFNFSENTISSMSSVEKRILVDSDLILHGYRLRFSELFEYLLQMSREIQKMEETSHPGYFCSHFNITSISVCYGNSIRIDDDIDQYTLLLEILLNYRCMFVHFLLIRKNRHCHRHLQSQNGQNIPHRKTYDR